MAGNLAAHPRAEQHSGCLPREADVEVAARVLLASCLGESFFCAIDPSVDAADHDRYLRGLVTTVLGGGLGAAMPASTGRSTLSPKE